MTRLAKILTFATKTSFLHTKPLSHYQASLNSVYQRWRLKANAIKIKDAGRNVIWLDYEPHDTQNTTIL